MASKLVFVPTPIGNLGDVSKRTIEAFETCDCVYCEDTRVTGKLLSALNIKKPLFRMDENSISEHVDELIGKALAGQTICFCSDAGMPAVSDPGSRIVSAAREAGVEIDVLPGANAALVALVQSGFDSTHFFFEGFLPKKAAAKKARLEEVMAMSCPVIIYESPNRAEDTLTQIAQIDGERRVCVARELTKLHQEVIVTCAKDINCITAKGEFAIVIDANIEDLAQTNVNRDNIESYINVSLERGISKKDICSDLQNFFGVTRNEAYKFVNLN